MFSRFRKPATLKSFAKTALLCVLCFAGSYFTWKHTAIAKDGGKFPDSLIGAYMTEASVSFGYTSDKEIVKKVYAPEAIQNISIDFQRTNVSVETSTSDKVEVTWMGQKERKSEELQATLDNGTLHLRLRDPEHFFRYHIGSEKYDYDGVKIALPLSLVFKPGMAKGIDPKNYVMPTEKTGQVNLSFKSEEGSLRVESTALNHISAETISGDIAIKGSIVHSATIKTVNGDVVAQTDLDGVAKIETISGDMALTLEALHAAYDFKTISGDVKLTLEQSADLNFAYKSHSGEISWNKESSVEGSLTKILGKGTSIVNIETVSGDAEISTK